MAYIGGKKILNVFAGNVMKTADLLAKVYPVGSVYMSTSNTSPASFLGGTWEELEADTFLRSVGVGGSSGEISGSNTHNHGSDNLIARIHVGWDDSSNVFDFKPRTGVSYNANKRRVWSSGTGTTETLTTVNGRQEGAAVTGETNDGSTIPKNMGVHVWKRIE